VGHVGPVVTAAGGRPDRVDVPPTAIDDHAPSRSGVAGARDGATAAVGVGEGDVVAAGTAGSVHFQAYQTIATVVAISMALKNA
jgi:hypothetical protein